MDSVVRFLSDEASVGILHRFALAREKQKHSAESVEAGREYVAAYVDYIHFIESLHHSLEGKSEDVNEQGAGLNHLHNKAQEK